MEGSKKYPNAQEQLDFIQSMIAGTRSNYRHRGSYYYLLWGWLTLTAAIANYILLTTGLTELHFIPWPIITLVGIVSSIVYGIRSRKKEMTESYLSHFMAVFFSHGSLLFIIGVFLCVTNNISPNPFVMLVSGVYGLVSGRLLQFTPLILGGIAFLILSVISNFLEMEWQLILLATGIVIGYLIPGYLLIPSNDA